MLKVDVVFSVWWFWWVVGGGYEAGLAFFAQAVAFAFDVEDGGAVQEAVEGGAGHDGITGEDVRPFGEGFVGSHDGGGVLFVTMADDLEEHGGAGLIEAEVADFIDDQQPGLGEPLHGVGQPVLGEGSGEATGHFQRRKEEEAVAEFGGDDAQRDGQVGFADAGRTEQEDVAAFR